MADTAVAITAGTGTNVDTRTEATNGNHRQVIVIGDPSTNAGVAPVDATKGLAVDLTASGALPTVTNLAQLGGAAIAMGTGARSAGTQRVTIATDDSVPVTIASVPSHAVTNAGTFAVQAASTLAAETTKNIGTVRVGDGTNTATVKAVSTAPVTATDQALVVAMRPDSPGIIATGTQASPSASYLSTVAAGDVAAGSSDFGNPQKIGGVGKTANPTAVTDGQRVNALFDKLGKQVTVEAIRDLKGVTQTSVSNTTSETTIVAAVASTFLDLYGLILANTGASTTKVTIKDATAGTTRAIIEVPTLETRGFMLPVSGAIPQATVNNNWTVTCGTATTALEVTALWVKNT